VFAEIAEIVFNNYTKKYMIEKTSKIENLFDVNNTKEDIQNMTFKITTKAVEK